MPTSPQQAIRILMVDDHEIVRAGVRMLIESHPNHAEMTVAGEARNQQEALTMAARLQPDVILLDLNLGGEIDLGLIPALLAAVRDTHILILTGLRDPELYHRAMHLGAVGVVLKEQTVEVLLEAIETIRHGEFWIDRAIWADVAAQLTQAREEAEQNHLQTIRIATLTKRERQIIALVSGGLKNQQVADQLSISEGTIRNHLTVIFEKLGLSGRFELVIYAHRHGLRTFSHL